MRDRLAIAMVAGTLAGLSAMPLPGKAQSTGAPPTLPFQVPQNPPILPEPPPPSAAPPTPISPAVPVTPLPTPGSTLSSSYGKSFGTVGRGLPGMLGGPPLNATPGAQDPSFQYMRPQVIGPLYCDPAMDLPC
jgi:hypothetical protein